MATSNGSTAIRDKILASLARYRALRIGKFPCAFWRLSSRPGLTAVEGERYVIQVYLQSKTNRGRIVLNVWAEEPFSEYKTPLTLGLAKKFWLSTDDYDQTHFTTKFTPETTGRYNIETYSADEDTVMEIYHPDGHSMVARGESAGAPCYLTKFRDSCRHNSFTYAA
ncbi:hypothetical protein BMR11_15765, partial [Methylococcaceae bacterium CS5]